LPDGNPKPEGLRKLERQASATRKKIVATIRDGHPALIRDIKNLALALYYCLFTKQDVILYTADADLVSLFLRWVDAMSMRSTLLFEVLKKLGEDGRSRVARGGQTTIVLPADEFIEKRAQWFRDIVNDSYKTSGCRFTIKRWDQNTHTFEDDVYITFEDEVAEALARSHGNMWCHFTKNNELGNWVHLVYEWPTPDPTSRSLRVKVRSKPIKSRSTLVTVDEHNHRCSYKQTDAAGCLHKWSQFGWDNEHP
jgi:hypothetical protein